MSPPDPATPRRPASLRERSAAACDQGPTTASLQTPPGRGGIAVIVLAGAAAERILSALFQPLAAHARDGEDVLRLGHLRDDKGKIDEAIVARRGAAFEINIHGGPAAARATLERLAQLGATIAREASPADSFLTRHPRWNNPAIGREMLDVLPKTKSTLVRAALSAQWAGGLSRMASGEPSSRQLRQAAAAYEVATRLLNPADVVLAGRPNVGKSTLANVLVGRPVSLVHETPGTTRDWVRELAVLNGVPVWLTDTAGLWDAPGEIDGESVCRARSCMEAADLVVLLHAGADLEVPDWLGARRLLRIASKCDVAPPTDASLLPVSALSGQGVAELRQAIIAALGLAGFSPEVPMAFTTRQRDLCAAAADAMDGDHTSRADALLAELLEG